MQKQTWQIWIDDCFAEGGGYVEDAADDIVARHMAQLYEVNEYLVSIDQEPVFRTTAA